MISVDSRTGSAELAKHFTPYGIKVEVTKLEYGDFDFLGRGPFGECAIVFERKRIEDLVDSMRTGRFSGHQLPGLAKSYDYAYLIVEGIWRPGHDSQLEVNANGRWVSRGMHTRAINNYIMGLATRAGIIPWRTVNQQDTVAFIVDQYRMWTEKAWSEHKSHDVVYAPADPVRGFGITLNPRTITTAEKVAMQLPGLQDKARYAAERFKSVYGLATASLDQWIDLPWKTRKGGQRKLGESSARKIVKAIKGEL